MQHENRPVADDSIGLRAAQYLRMSTDHQRYSTENQAAAISTYAAQRNLTIVRTYTDHGRSGLRLDGREDLQRLISDVKNGDVDFNFILVYDVSRWGRFQDADESAYYEFICKEAGIRVHYCAEQFENDGSLASTILKNMKRVMAGEYSRELSAKVFIGQCRGAKLGFWQGGSAPYGLRRLLVDESRFPKFRLERGQQKNLQTDRVMLAPGPAAEVKVVRRIFSAYATDLKSLTDIASELNAKGIRNALGNPWSDYAIYNILRSEKYVGNNVYNRSSLKLKAKQVINPPEMWIRGEGAFPAIIAPDVFSKAQSVMAKRRQGLSDQDLLDRLAALWREKGRLSKAIIDAAPGIPAAARFHQRFGNLVIAYERIGFKPRQRLEYVQAEPSLRKALATILSNIVVTVQARGGSVAIHKRTRVLTINDAFTVALGMGWRFRGDTAHLKWKVYFAKIPTTDLCLVIRMDEANKEVRDYYLLPTAEVRQAKPYRLFISNPVFAESYRHDTLDHFFRLCARSA